MHGPRRWQRQRPVVSVAPVGLPIEGRVAELQLRVSAPVSGTALPIILLSHGQGFSNNLSSLNGYGPLAHFWAAHGFVVIQPTHLSSKTLQVDPATPGAPAFWRSRVQDMSAILDCLDVVEAAVPGLAGRVDSSRIAVAGHSMGGHTAGMLLGARLTDPDTAAVVDMADHGISAGILLAAPGDGGDSLNDFATRNVPFFRQPDFSTMSTPTLVVVGDRDASTFLTTRGYDAAETTDENPERVAAIQRLTWAYLRSALYPDGPSWTVACSALARLDALGTIECK